MSILRGFKKARAYKKTDNGYIWESRDVHGETVYFNDNDTAETKVGAIKGITTSTDVTEEGYAADATTVAALNYNLGEDENGMTIHEKLDKLLETATSGSKVYYLGSGTSFNVKALFPDEYMNFTPDNFIFTVTALYASSSNNKGLDRGGYTAGASSTPIITYNNGIATINNISCSGNSGLMSCSASMTCELYLIAGGISSPSIA